MKIRIRSSRAAGDFTGAMTDISFLLIIFFLVTTVFMTAQGILLHLPGDDTEPKRLSMNEIVLVEIISDSEYIVNRGEVIVLEALSETINKSASLLPEPVLVLLVSGEVTYQNVLDVLELSKSSGITKFSVQYKDSKPIGLKIEREAS